MNERISPNDQKTVDEIKRMLPLVLPMPNPNKSRCLLGLAYEYFIMDMEEEAYKLLLMADPEYFKDQLAEDMKEMPNMKEVVLTIMHKLVELGLIKVVPSENH
jgi:predicted transcriptional regulator